MSPLNTHTHIKALSSSYLKYSRLSLKLTSSKKMNNHLYRSIEGIERLKRETELNRLQIRSRTAKRWSSRRWGVRGHRGGHSPRLMATKEVVPSKWYLRSSTPCKPGRRLTTKVYIPTYPCQVRKQNEGLAQTCPIITVSGCLEDITLKMQRSRLVMHALECYYILLYATIYYYKLPYY